MEQKLKVLDLFSAAAGGWSLGMHRAGFCTIAACEVIDWRRALYAQNNPGVVIYDDVCTLTADRLVSDLGCLPDIIVGSPPCQDISVANTKGKGVEGERSKLYFEAARLVGECRPRWFALENSANLRTRGADTVLAALERLGYAVWPFVVGANLFTDSPHERKRSWLVGCDESQITDARQAERWAHPIEGSNRNWQEGERPEGSDRYEEHPALCAGNPADADEAGQAAGLLEPSLRPPQEPFDGCRDGRGDDGTRHGQVGWGESLDDDFEEPWAGWNSGLAAHLQLDAGLSSWVAGTRIAVGGPRGTSAASLIVEAFGDSVIPQIPEAIGRAILRTEAALSSVLRKAA
jgi:DNA (cytosine-5)-methyltransferase 1